MSERVHGIILSELILGQMLAVWQSVNTIPSGFMRCAPSAYSVTVGPPKAGFKEGVPPLVSFMSTEFLARRRLLLFLGTRV